MIENSFRHTRPRIPHCDQHVRVGSRRADQQFPRPLANGPHRPDRVLLARCWIVAFVVRNPDRLRQTKGSSQGDPSRRSEFSAHSPLPNRIRNVIRNLEEMYGKSPDLVGASN